MQVQPIRLKKLGVPLVGTRLHDVRLESICQHGVELLPNAEWKRVTLDSRRTHTFCTNVKYDILFNNPDIAREEVFIMSNCFHNDIVGLSNRYMKATEHGLTYDRTIVNSILDDLCAELKKNFDGPITLNEFLDKKKGALGKRYTRAATQVSQVGFDLEKHSRMTAFIKNEIYNECKPPRMIMGRDPRFNLIYGLFTTALEHAMVRLPQISKGRSFFGRGEQFFNQVFGADILECDCSKFEATQRQGLLAHVELGIWKRLLEEPDYRIIRQLWIAKMRKRGHTLNGVYFDFWGCRGSGDMDTGLFNTLLMYVACRYFEIINNTGKGNFVCDGDDNLVKIPIGQPYVNTFSQFGFDAKLIRRHDYHDASYCSGKFIQWAPGKFMYAQDLRKLMNNLRVFRKTKFQHCKSQYYHSLGYMYKRLYGNLPLYRNISKFLLRNTTNQHVNMDILTELNPAAAESFRLTEEDPLFSFDESFLRTEIEMAFDLTSNQIDACAEWYDKAKLEFSPDECKTYRNCGKPAERLSRIQIENVALELKVSTLTHTFSYAYCLNIEL